MPISASAARAPRCQPLFRFRQHLLWLVAAAFLVACGAKEGPVAAVGSAARPKMPPAQVGVVIVQPQPIALQSELPGRVSALRVAQVRARVSGVVLRRLFREGSEVKAGQPLFQIDAATYQAALDSAQATLGKAQANLAQATNVARRYQPLVAANAVSELEYSSAVANQRLAEADVAGARAMLKAARINFDYATVRAPIAGHIGQSLVTEGALVSQTEATQMALIQQTRSVYVNFTQSSGDVLRLRKALAAKQLRGAGKNAAQVRVVLEDGSELPDPGQLLFSDLSVDAGSGQITLRAQVPNPDGLMLPGQYVRVRLTQAELPSAILLPQQAVTRSNQGDSVLVVGADNIPARRQIKIHSSQNNQWVVQDGLQPGEQVIVEGFQKMMVPGAPVKAMPWGGDANGKTAATPVPGASAQPASAAGSAAMASKASAPTGAAAAASAAVGK